MLALSKSDIQQVVPMREAVELMKMAFQELSAGRAQAPVRSVLEVNDGPSAMLMMPGFVPAYRSLGFKVVSFFSGNRERDLPVIHALVCLLDDQTGLPLGLLEGGWVTALRTGAVSGAATDLLARPDSKVLVVIGAGVQGVTQAAAVCSVRPIERIVAVDTSDVQLARFRENVERDFPELASLVQTTTDADWAVGHADVICTATTARSAVFSDAALKPGVHINAIGAFTPEMVEIPVETIGRARIITDNFDAIMAEAGDLLAAIDAGVIGPHHLKDELGDLVAGRIAGRSSDDQVTLFKSVGNAVQDVVVARYAIEQADARGLGIRLDLSS